jgi:hypothetical protein
MIGLSRLMLMTFLSGWTWRDAKITDRSMAEAARNHQISLHRKTHGLTKFTNDCYLCMEKLFTLLEQSTNRSLSSGQGEYQSSTSLASTGHLSIISTLTYFCNVIIAKSLKAFCHPMRIPWWKQFFFDMDNVKSDNSITTTEILSMKSSQECLTRPIPRI